MMAAPCLVVDPADELEAPSAVRPDRHNHPKVPGAVNLRHRFRSRRGPPFVMVSASMLLVERQRLAHEDRGAGVQAVPEESRFDVHETTPCFVRQAQVADAHLQQVQ